MLNEVCKPLPEGQILCGSVHILKNRVLELHFAQMYSSLELLGSLGLLFYPIGYVLLLVC